MLKALILGNLGADPEVRYSANGSAFLRFNVATNDRRRDADGNWFDHTEWVRVTVLGNRVDTLQQYLHKGMRVYVDGRLEARPWIDQQDNVRAGLELVANDVQFASSRQDDEQSQNRQQRQPSNTGGGQQQRQQGGQGQAPQRNTRQQLGLEDEDLETLPF